MVSPVIDEIAGEHPEIKVGKIANQAVGAIPKQQILDMLK